MAVQDLCEGAGFPFVNGRYPASAAFSLESEPDGSGALPAARLFSYVFIRGVSPGCPPAAGGKAPRGFSAGRKEMRLPFVPRHETVPPVLSQDGAAGGKAASDRESGWPERE